MPGRKMPRAIIDRRLFRRRPLSPGDLLVPGHLNGFELRLVRRFRIVAETVERHDPLAQVGEADGQRIEARELLGERDADVFRVGPLHRATSSCFALRSDFPSWMPPPSWT